MPCTSAMCSIIGICYVTEERAVRSIDAFVTTELRARRTGLFATQLLAVWKCHQVLVHTCVILEVGCGLMSL